MILKGYSFERIGEVSEKMSQEDLNLKISNGTLLL